MSVPDREMLQPTLVIEESPIHGRGVFARQRFNHGEVITRVTVVREITVTAPLRPDLGELPEHCGHPEGRVLLYAAPGRHVNHSCDPNGYETYEQGEPVFRARRLIQVGEEITVDYDSNHDGQYSLPCRCGAARCRGVIGCSFFGLPLEIQFEYRPVLAAWFAMQHEARLSEMLQLARSTGRAGRS